MEALDFLVEGLASILSKYGFQYWSTNACTTVFAHNDPEISSFAKRGQSKMPNVLAS
jgi:hypothetical protein